MCDIIIRTDSSTEIGTGHVMRCLTLARALREQGCRVTFFARSLPGNINSIIEIQGFRVIEPQASAKTSNCSVDWWKEDAIWCTQELAKVGIRPKWFIVDHYGLDVRWESQIRPYVERIMVIDDLADRRHDCDLILDQNFYRGPELRYNKLLPPQARQLLGPQFALLRKEFREIRNKGGRSNGRVERIFVSFGGSDPTNETSKVLRALGNITRRDFSIDVVAGKANPNSSEVERLTLDLPGSRFFHHVDRMAELMAEADLAIGAGGATTWERCCLGLASAVVTVAPNQILAAQTLAQCGFQYLLGDHASLSVERLEQELINVLSDQAGRQEMSSRSMDLVDGNGAERVSSLMLGRLE